MKVPSLHWLGQAAFRIETGNHVIYIDPVWLQSDAPKASLILVTHSHPDHYSERAIKYLSSPETRVYAPVGFSAFTPIKPGDTIDFDPELSINAVAAYNIHKSFHPRQNNWVGYIIHCREVKIYHAGDTDLIPEMNDITADIALLPIGGTYTMDFREAAEAAKLIKPKTAIPIHYGSTVGTAREAQEFVRMCQGMGINSEMLKIEH
ncbi:MAG: MBL fold metallo-hydrolase [Bacillota bacterium]